MGGKITYFISFTDGQGAHHDLEVSEELFVEFRQMERKNRNLEQSNERHREYSEISEETLNKRARVIPKRVEEIVELRERMEIVHREVSVLPEKQRRRFILYYEYGMTYAKIGELEGCTGSSIKCSIDAARRKIIEKLNMRERQSSVTAKCRHICHLEKTATVFCRRTCGIDRDGRIAVIIGPSETTLTAL